MKYIVLEADIFGKDPWIIGRTNTKEEANKVINDIKKAKKSNFGAHLLKYFIREDTGESTGA